MGITHFDEAPAHELEVGHLRGRWTFLGDVAGCLRVGVRRLQVPAGGWSTPAHEHGREEEIFYVLDGHGLSWQAGQTSEIGPGDCILYLPGHGAHTVHGVDALDVLAFGTRHRDESPRFPRLGLSLIGNRAAETLPGSVDGAPIQFIREAAMGPAELSASPGERPGTIVNVADVRGEPFGRSRISAERRNLGVRIGSVETGLKHVRVAPGKDSAPLHCHSVEEEIFVVLEGSGALLLGEEEVAVRPGHVIARPAGTGVAHAFRAGEEGLAFLAYGTREPGDLCYYPRSGKISFRGLGVIARVERLDYWDGED